MRASIFVAAAAALAPAVHAAVFVTNPVSLTVCEGSKPCVVQWKDDGKTPTLAEMGDVTVGLFTGNAQQQTLLQDLGVTNAATAQEIQFVPNPTVGEDFDRYFIKMTSVNLADAASPQYKTNAFSAMFTLKGMTGKFNETIRAQIAGSSATSSGTVAPAGTTTGASSTTAKITTTGTSTSSSATGTAANANNAANNGAGSIAVGMGMFGATVLAAFAAVL
ncbi:unnamed protein product [Rhizoctonia solani]|uniref:Yeast cell wall synthesis Kre9/Knh1-like N-terminal domain-containing protein n=1 Tax=Rhizoctonia solani TaxID=456999 RepID=A0A8H2WBW8_9AGAM|nr:unnamed protein product [Rhizoctonia solani]